MKNYVLSFSEDGRVATRIAFLFLFHMISGAPLRPAFFFPSFLFQLPTALPQDGWPVCSLRWENEGWRVRWPGLLGVGKASGENREQEKRLCPRVFGCQLLRGGRLIDMVENNMGNIFRTKFSAIIQLNN
jgi:hypothetical protein